MRQEFIALSAPGAFALAFGGFLLGEAYVKLDGVYVLLACLMLLIVRNDARVDFKNGNYNLGWFFWKRQS